MNGSILNSKLKVELDGSVIITLLIIGTVFFAMYAIFKMSIPTPVYIKKTEGN